MENAKIVRSIISLSWVSLLLVVCILTFSFPYRNIETVYGTQVIDISPINTGNNISEPLIKTYTLGKKLFMTNCASCHNKNMQDDMVGPALAGVQERWEKYPLGDLYSWIRNSSLLIAGNHPKAVSLWKEWKSTMTSFPHLSDEDIESLIVYIENK